MADRVGRDRGDGNLLGRVHHFINNAADDGEGRLAEPVTYEQIGALMEWAETLADVLDTGIRRARSVQDATLNDLTSMRLEGSLCSVPRYNRYGHSNYTSGGALTEEAAAGLLKRIGRAVGADV